jgi:DNA-binding NtrC family response regulator
MESEFFGYKKGAFTGAEADRDGFFQAANGGTLFLDEVADLPLAMQVKLLRAIQEKKVRKVGSTTEDAVDTRLISATHKNLAALVENGEFRQDLYYRLHVIELSMPSLREMREDIPLIANAILTRLARGNPAGLEPEAVAALERYPFPGNVRELENIPSADSRSRRNRSASPRRICTSRRSRTKPKPRFRPGRSGRCRIISTGSSVPRSTRRWRRRAITARRRRSCWGSRSGRCVTGWSGWGSSKPGLAAHRHDKRERTFSRVPIAASATSRLARGADKSST